MGMRSRRNCRAKGTGERGWGVELDSTAPLRPQHPTSLGLEKLGLVALAKPWASALIIAAVTMLAVAGFMRLKIDDSLSELFRSDTEEFRRYEEIDHRFPSSEYDVLVVVEGPDLLKRQQLAAFSHAMTDLNLADGVNGLVSMLSARAKPDATGYAPPLVPDPLPESEADYAAMIKRLADNDIVKGKFLSADGTLALAVISLDRALVQEKGSKPVIGGIKQTVEDALKGSGLTVKLTGAPVMQLEIRNAYERDQLLYNGLGALFGAGVAMLFFRRVSLMVVAALPPILAVTWSLGLLGWLGFKLNLFLDVLTPLVMVMGFADSMQMTSAIRDRLRHGDDKAEAVAFAVKVVGPACVIAHGTALVSFLSLLLSESALIRTFGMAGAAATVVSYFAVVAVLPVLALGLIRNEASLSAARAPVDAWMDSLGTLVGWIVDRVVKHPVFYTVLGFVLFGIFSAAHLSLQPRYRLADQVPDREEALAATGRLDQKLTGANPVHVMVQWPKDRSLYDPATLDTIAAAQSVLEKQAGLGNVWSLESLRRWLAEAGDNNIETVKRYVGLLPEHLTRRFISADEKAALVTARLPDIDASQILPVVDKIDTALEPVRKAHPGYDIWVTGLPAIAARNSASMIQQLNAGIPLEVGFVAVLVALAFRSLFTGVLSLLPALFPIVAAGFALWLMGTGLEFASVVALVVIFGLGVDGLIHFLNRLRLEERPGEDPALAIRRARVLVGPAIILTTIVLAFGLGVTAFSSLPSLRLFGAVCAITLMASLIGDLVFLPATIVVWRRIFGAKGT